MKLARIGGQITALNHFMKFILTLENPPLNPWLVSRQVHITDVKRINKNTFFNYLIEHVSEDGKTLQTIISSIRKFFLWLRDFLIISGKQEESKFLDPILETDRLGTRTRSNHTSRDSLPPFLITEMKEILVDDDFAYPKIMDIVLGSSILD
jgi:hypothetical protein